MMESAAAAGRREGGWYAFGIWPADPRQLAAIRAELRRWLAPLEMSGEAREDMVLAVSEAAANSIEHAYSEATEDDTFQLIFWTEPGTVCIEIVDHGEWQTPPSEPDDRGRGIPLMHRLVESVLISNGPNGTRVLLRCPMQDGSSVAPGGLQAI